MDSIWQTLWDTANAALHPRRISDYVTCGEVSAAILS